MMKLNHLAPYGFKLEQHIADEPMVVMCKRAYYGLSITKPQAMRTKCTCGANDQLRCFLPLRDRMKPQTRWGFYTAQGDDWLNFLVSNIPIRTYWGMYNMARLQIEVDEKLLWTPEWNEETQELIRTGNVIQVANEMGLAGVNITEEFVAATNHFSYYDIPQVIISQKEWHKAGVLRRVHIVDDWVKVPGEIITRKLLDFGYTEKQILEGREEVRRRMSDDNPRGKGY